MHNGYSIGMAGRNCARGWALWYEFVRREDVVLSPCSYEAAPKRVNKGSSVDRSTPVSRQCRLAGGHAVDARHMVDRSRLRPYLLRVDGSVERSEPSRDDAVVAASDMGRVKSTPGGNFAVEWAAIEVESEPQPCAAIDFASEPQPCAVDALRLRRYLVHADGWNEACAPS